MARLRKWSRKWFRKSPEQDLERELHSHLELEAEEQRGSGLSPDDAPSAAQRAFGNTTLVMEDMRAMWTWTPIDRLAQDLRYALRTMRKNLGFSAAAILSLALGIGANTAIFSLIDTLLLRSLPVRNPAELVQVLCGFSSASFNLTSRDGSERVSGAWVTGEYYRTLGLEALAGRLLTPGDDQPGAPPVAVLSYAYWQTRFAGDFGVLGQSIRIGGKPVKIVGVSPRGFSGANVGDAANLTLPLAALAQVTPERAPQLDRAGGPWSFPPMIRASLLQQRKAAPACGRSWTRPRCGAR